MPMGDGLFLDGAIKAALREARRLLISQVWMKVERISAGSRSKLEVKDQPNTCGFYSFLWFLVDVP